MKSITNIKNIKKKVFFAGSGAFAVPQIEALAKTYNLGIITQKNNTPVKKEVVKLNLKIREVQKAQELENLLEELKPEILIVSDFGIILSEKSLKIPKLVLNTHPSLLPKYRGPSPYVTALLNGEKETGVSLIKMTEEMDAGPIFLKEKVKIAKRETSTSLREKLGNLAGNLLLSNLEKIIAGKIEPISQNEKEATYTKFFKKEDGLIDWEEDAKLIERKIRAFTPWPGTFTFFETPKKKIRVKILYAEVEEGNALKPEEIKIENKKLKIKTGKDYIVVKKLQPEGKREMIAEEFLHGYQIKLKV